MKVLGSLTFGIPSIWDALFLCLFFLTVAALAFVILFLKDNRGRLSIAMLLASMTWIAVFFGVVIPMGRWLSQKETSSATCYIVR